MPASGPAPLPEPARRGEEGGLEPAPIYPALGRLSEEAAVGGGRRGLGGGDEGAECGEEAEEEDRENREGGRAVEGSPAHLWLRELIVFLTSGRDGRRRKFLVWVCSCPPPFAESSAHAFGAAVTDGWSKTTQKDCGAGEEALLFH